MKFFTYSIAMLLLTITFSRSVAQEGWDDMAVGFQSVIIVDDTCRMWYTGSSPLPIGSIGYAWSLDGISWEKYPGNPVLVDEPFDGWNEVTVYEPCVIHDGTLFHMWYTSSNNVLLPGPIHIHHATSADGLTWSKDTVNNPVLSPGSGGSWDNLWVDSHCIIKVDTMYHMWYAGCNGNGVRIGHATSTDGVNWTKDASNPVLTFGVYGSWEYNGNVGRVEAPVVIYDGSTYHLWYSGGDHSRWQIGYATSPDGVSWTKYESNPVLRLGANGDWDDTWVGGCSVIMDTSTADSVTFRMWYSGSNKYLVDQNSWRAVSQVGYATSPDGITWTKYASNPVVKTGTPDRILDERNRDILNNFSLYQNYPNPFNPVTNIEYRLTNADFVNLIIYDILGQKVATLVNQKQAAGSYTVKWDAGGFASGIYYYTLRVGEQVQTRKMVLMK